MDILNTATRNILSQSQKLIAMFENDFELLIYHIIIYVCNSVLSNFQSLFAFSEPTLFYYFYCVQFKRLITELLRILTTLLLYYTYRRSYC